MPVRYRGNEMKMWTILKPVQANYNDNRSMQAVIRTMLISLFVLLCWWQILLPIKTEKVMKGCIWQVSEIRRVPLCWHWKYFSVCTSTGNMYRRGARRWRKLYRVNCHLFQAKRFSRVTRKIYVLNFQT